MRQLRNANGISSSRFVDECSGFEYDKNTTQADVDDYFTMKNFESMFCSDDNSDIDQKFLDSCAEWIMEQIEEIKSYHL